jgi:predicted nucleic-acid-binding protein
MLVADTNIMVRLITLDDPAQAALAKRVIGQEAVWIGITVLLELVWVLGSIHRYRRTHLHSVLSDLLQTPTFVVEDEMAVAQALTWFLQGGDFADALHLARSKSKGVFLTFDADFCKPARADGVSVEVLTVSS